MSRASQVLKIFGMIFAGICIAAGIIMPFTDHQGVHGYSIILLWISVAVVMIGAMLAYGAQSNRIDSPGDEFSGNLDQAVLDELRKDARSGRTLSFEVFFIGVGSLALSYALFALTR